ncbi:MAG: hypothetical protein QW548_02205 [Candidatus Aenigmatarchaeota archaeon]
MIDAIISDWNGVLYKDRDDSALFNAVTTAALKQSAPFHPVELFGLWQAKKQLEELKARVHRPDGSRDASVTREMYRIFNERVVKGLPVNFVDKAISRYASRRDVQERLDAGMLEVLVKRNLSTMLGVLSSAYEGWIDAVLGAGKRLSYVDFVVANKLEEKDGKAVAFLLDIFDNKPEHLRRAAATYRFSLDRTAYIGDDEDDEGCFELVRWPVVSLYSRDEFKKRCAEKYRAFVPESHDDFGKWLKGVR